jgi:ribonuclease BN (tRNA processing enzyme)
VVTRRDTGMRRTGADRDRVAVEVLSCHAGRSSGYLLRTGEATVLVDCGPGTAAALYRAGQLDQIDAVVITHQHADHAADVVGLAYARRFPEPLDPVPLHAPAATLDVLARLDDLFAVPTLPRMGNTIAASFELLALPMDGAARAVAPGLELASFPARHAVPSAALRFTAAEVDATSEVDAGVVDATAKMDAAGVDADVVGATAEAGGVTGGAVTVAFSSDTCRCDGLLAAAAHSGLFLCEATYLDASPEELVGHGHLTPGQAGQVAADAAVGRLALTHLAHPSAHEIVAHAAGQSFDPDRIVVASAGGRLGPKIWS